MSKELVRAGLEAAPDAMKPFQRFPTLPSSVLCRLRHSKLRLFVLRYGLIWREDETVETVSMKKPAPTPR